MNFSQGITGRIMAFQKADAKCLVWGLSRKKENGHDRVMRIDKRTASTLVEIAREHFGDVEVRLFGSRLDDSRRGGDIDIQIFAPESTYRDEVAFLADVEQRLGERVDLRVQRGEPLLIDTIAMDAGIVL